MKYSFMTAALLGSAAAFPTAVRDAVAADPESFEALAKEKRVNGINPGFDAKKQYVDVSGQHKWVAPGPNDQRGVCPGLNAFANHGFLPHNGIATIQQFIDATTSVVGMGADLAGFLAIYGAVFDGNLRKWSIGGPDSRVRAPLLEGLGIANQPQGLSGSHNKYEADVSPTRGDLYIFNNSYDAQPSQFKQFYATQANLADKDSADQAMNFDIGAQTNFRIQRFRQSISSNPYFFNNFFSGVLVQPAAYTFQYRFMANHSASYPEGRLGGEVLKSWFAMSGDYPNFKYTPGYERIPKNWYRRAYGDEYTIPFFFQDVVGMAAENPQFLDIGGNTGKVNSFTGIDLVNTTKGLYNTKDLADPQKLACFQYQMIQQQRPDILEGAANFPFAVLSVLSKATNFLSANYNCPKLNQATRQGFYTRFNGQIKQFPGATKLNPKTGLYN